MEFLLLKEDYFALVAFDQLEKLYMSLKLDKRRFVGLGLLFEFTSHVEKLIHIVLS
jgi:hypothetical protein